MQTLYHYCSTGTFSSIIKNRSVWLSSLSHSNDALEGKIFSRAMERRLRKDNVPEQASAMVRSSMLRLEEVVDALGLCLSEEGDLLSQWRGYADDARGFSIGFSKEHLESWAGGVDFGRLSLCQVKYEDDDHDKEIDAVYSEIKRLIDSDALNYPGLLDPTFKKKTHEELVDQYKSSLERMNMAIFFSFLKIFRMKDSAFKEEREWRLVSNIFYGTPEDYLIRAVSDKLIPYKEMRFSENNHPIITDVVVGPKNRTELRVINDFLKGFGFVGVNVRRSAASYR